MKGRCISYWKKDRRNRHERDPAVGWKKGTSAHPGMGRRTPLSFVGSQDSMISRPSFGLPGGPALFRARLFAKSRPFFIGRPVRLPASREKGWPIYCTGTLPQPTSDADTDDKPIPHVSAFKSGRDFQTLLLPAPDAKTSSLCFRRSSPKGREPARIRNNTPGSRFSLPCRPQDEPQVGWPIGGLFRFTIRARGEKAKGAGKADQWPAFVRSGCSRFKCSKNFRQPS